MLTGPHHRLSQKGPCPTELWPPAQGVSRWAASQSSLERSQNPFPLHATGLGDFQPWNHGAAAGPKEVSG